MQIFYVLFFIIFFQSAYSANITSNGSNGNWNLGSCWVGGFPPAAGDNAIIAAGDTVTISANTSITNVTLLANGSLNFSSAKILSVSGNLLMNAGSSIDGSSTGIINVSGTFTGATGGTETIGRLTITISSTSTINGILLFSSAGGTPTFSSNVTVAAAGGISFSAAQTVVMGGNLNANAGSVIGGGSAIGVINIAGDFNTLTGGTTTIGGVTLNITGNLAIKSPSAVLNAASANNTINLSGNWTVTSTAADPFVEGLSLVKLVGASGTQAITTVLAAGETFYNLTLTNSSASSPGVSTSKNLTVTQAYNQTGSGSLDLKGHTLLVASQNNIGSFVTCNLSAGQIISSSAGAVINFTDANDSTNVLFSGTNVGSAARSIPLTINVGRMCLANLELYGVGNFTKSLDYGTTSCGGGNKYHNKVTFTSPASGGHWRMGNNSAPPDTFLAVSTFNANANGSAGNNNFILGAGSSGNYYADSVYLTSTTVGGLYVGRSNDNKTNSHTFKGPVVVNVVLTGNVTFAESSSSKSDSVIFKNTLQLNSSNTSTGDLFIGNSSGYSTINFTSTGQLIDGNINGATNIYFYGVTQTGSLLQKTTSTAASSSTIYLGNSAAANIWNGPVTFASANINLANSTYNGNTNNFTVSGAASQNCTGGNTFAAGTLTNFVNSGTGSWNLAYTTLDNYNGDVTYARFSSGKLNPAYATACNYAGNITILAGSDSVDFASGGGNVVLSGTSSANFTNNGTKGTSMKSITMNKTGGASFTLKNSVGVPANGSLALNSGLLNTSSSAFLYLMKENVTVLPTVTSASTSYINGPMRYDMSISASTKNLLFPIGKGADCRPFTLTVQHSGTTSYSYMGEVFDSSAVYSNYTLPATVDTVSGVHFWNINRTVTSSGVSASSTNLNYSAGAYPLIQLYFGTNDYVYQGANLTIVKNTAAAPTKWIDIGASCALGNFSTPQAGSVISTTSGTPFNSFSTFTLGSKLTGWNSLPIELLSFTAVPNGSKVDLKWETATETNNAYFTIEKSKDGVLFTKLIDIPGAGNSTSQKDYYESDYQPYDGTSYYRLKQTDFNGAYKYFPMQIINFAASKSILVYPNPLNKTDNISVKLNGYKNEQVTVVLRDMQGREFFTKVLLSDENNQLFIIDEFHSIPEGTYIVTASSNDKIFNYKITVK
ncbi:MAG: T9SS type A sorting domain-containing protein [Bacteroidia bacterium]